MRGGRIRGRSHLDPITDRVRPKTKETAGKLSGVILFAAVLGVAPLTFGFDWLLGGNWLVSTLSAIAVAAVLAIGVLLLIDL